MQIKWTDTDPETGQRRFLCAERFAGVWSFKWKLQRRGDWTKGLEPTRAMWEHVLDSLKLDGLALMPIGSARVFAEQVGTDWDRPALRASTCIVLLIRPSRSHSPPRARRR